MRTHQPASRSFLLSLVTVVITAAALLFLLPAPRGRAQIQELFVNATRLGDPVPYFTARTGFSCVTVGAGKQVTGMGRLRADDETGTRTLEVRAADGSNTLVNSCTVEMGLVAAGQTAWCSFPAPSTLAASARYRFVTDEAAAPSQKEAEGVNYTTLTPGLCAAGGELGGATVYGTYEQTAGAFDWAEGVSPAEAVYGGVNLRFDTAVPTAAPSSLTAAAGTHFSGSRLIDLQWVDNASDELGFLIERCTGASCSSYTQVGSVGRNRLSYVDLGAAAATTYRYRVRAFKAGTVPSAYSNVTSDTPTGAVPTPSADLVVRNAINTAGSTSISAIVGEVLVFDGRASTGYKQQLYTTGFWGVPGVHINYGETLNGKAQEAHLLLSGHAYQTAGNYMATLTVRNESGTSSTDTVSVTVTEPTFTTVVDMTNSGSAYYIAPADYTTQGTGNTTKLVNALTFAAGNSTTVNRQIIVPAGAEFHTTGITWPNRSGSDSNWIKLKTSGTLPGVRERIFPADDAQLPHVRVTCGSGQESNSAFNVGNSPGATTQKHHYIVDGMKISKFDTTCSLTSLVYHAGYGGGWDTQEEVPHHFIYDHVRIDGNATIPNYTGIGMRVDADYLSVRNSHITEIRRHDNDALVFQGGTFTEGQSYWNNELEATGELFIYGGGASQEIAFTGTLSSPTRTSATLTSANLSKLRVGDRISTVIGGVRAADGGRNTGTTIRTINHGTGAITFDDLDVAPDTTAGAVYFGPLTGVAELRNNHGYKDPALRAGNPYGGFMKNLVELKQGTSIVIDGNVLHGQWDGTNQPTAPCFMVTVQNQFGDGHFLTIENLQVSNNYCYEANSFINIVSSADDGTDAQEDPHAAQEARNFYFHNNLARDLGQVWEDTGAQNTLNVNGTIRGFLFSHNTILYPVQSGNLLELSNVQGNRILDLLFLDNIVDYGSAGWKGQMRDPWTGSTFSNHNALALMRAQAPDYLVKHNVITGTLAPTMEANGEQITNSTVPGMVNTYVTTPPISATTYVATASGVADNTGHGNTDIGVDMTQLVAAIGASSTTLGTATFKVVTGDWSAATPLFTGVILAKDATYFDGEAGFKFTTVANPGRVHALGRLVLSGNSGTITLRIREYIGDSTPGPIVAERDVDLSSAPPGEIAWAPLEDPPTLLGDTVYLVTSQESNTSNLEAEAIDYVLMPGFATGIVPQYWTGTNWLQGGGAAEDVYCGVNLKFGP